jgi:hypothetical protein
VKKKGGKLELDCTAGQCGIGTLMADERNEPRWNYVSSNRRQESKA